MLDIATLLEAADAEASPALRSDNSTKPPCSKRGVPIRSKS